MVNTNNVLGGHESLVIYLERMVFKSTYTIQCSLKSPFRIVVTKNNHLHCFNMNEHAASKFIQQKAELDWGKQ